MKKEENSVRKSSYKAALVLLKAMPMLLALFDLANTTLCFLGIECCWLSFFGGVSILSLLFLIRSEFLDSIVHEVHHFAVSVAEEMGKDLAGEFPAYVAGDTIRELADIMCVLGCKECNE